MHGLMNFGSTYPLTEMKRFLTSSSKLDRSPSFALISVLALVSLAAITATAFLASARLERQATMPLAQTTTLDMALDAGATAASKLLDFAPGEQFNFVTTYWRGTNEADWTNELGYLLVGAVPENAGVNLTEIKYFFCFSGSQLTNLGTIATNTYNIQDSADNQATFSRQIGYNMRTNGTNFANGQSTNIPLLGDTPISHFTSPPVGWVYIKQDVRVKPGSTNTTNVPVARFAFYVQDLSSMIDAERMGGEINRSTGTNPAEISLTNLTGTALTAPAKVDTFTASSNRPKYLTPGMLTLSLAGGLNPNDLRYVTTGLRHWTNAYERIPLGLFYSNCGTTQAGTKKYNLNTADNLDVSKISSWITTNLTTNFLARAGGLTNSILYTPSDFDYAKCLAANIVDYIDPDSIPTALDAAQGYRGTEALPYLTELALRYRLEDGASYNDQTNVPITVPTPANRIRPSINAYLELWNPYVQNIPLSELGISFKSYGTDLPTSTSAFAIGCNQFYATMDTIAANYKNGSSGPLSKLTFDFSKGTNALGISNSMPGYALSSNGYCLIKLDHDLTWTNIGPLGDTNNWRKKNATDFRFIYGDADKTNRKVYFARNTAAFSNDCMVVGAPNITTVGNSPGSAGLCELSLSNVVYDRARNLEMIATTPSNSTTDSGSGDSGVKYQSWQPSLIIKDPGVGSRLLSSGDPRITYFLRPLTKSDPLFLHVAFSNTSFGGPNTNTQLASTSKSLSTNSSFLDPSCRLDVTQWSDRGHNPTAYGTNPAGTDPEKISSNAPDSNSVAVTGFNRAPAFIRNGPMTNILELGNIYDPILWRKLTDGNITSSSTNDPRFGGGNTLRIGRPEHPRFAWTTNLPGAKASDPAAPNMQQSAAALLDLFCVSNNYSEAGKINLNTAPAPVLRALAGGIYLRSDPNLKVGAALNPNYPIPAEMAEAFAQGVMRFRAQYPFYSPSQLAFIATTTNWSKIEDSWPADSVFGNTNAIALSVAPGNSLSSASNNVSAWNDQAAEEWFSKIFQLSTVYSRNFRVYVIAQKATTNSSGDFIGVGPVARKYYNLLIKQNGTEEGESPGASALTTFQSYY
jgi:hypothetical protein